MNPLVARKPLLNRVLPAGAALLVLTGALLGTAACTKEYSAPLLDQQALLTGRATPADTALTRWRITARTTTYNGQAYDLYAETEACRRNNYRQFLIDTLLVWHPSQQACVTPQADTVAQGYWRLTDDGTALILRNDPDLVRRQYTIQELTATQLVLFNSEKTVNGSALTETVTLTAR